MQEEVALVRWRMAAYGALAAGIGAACMTVVRSVARRFGFIEKTVPQVVEEWLAASIRLDSGGKPSLHHALDQVLHVGYGAAYGAAYGALCGGRPHRTVPSGVVLGVGTWLIGSGIVLPVTGAGRGLWRRALTENGVDLLAHLVFGLATEVVRDDLTRHTEAGRPSARRRVGARAG